MGFSVAENGYYDGQDPVDPYTKEPTSFFKIINKLPGRRYLVVADISTSQQFRGVQHAFVISRPNPKGGWLIFDSINDKAMYLVGSINETRKTHLNIDQDLEHARRVVFYEHSVTREELIPEE